MITCVAAFSSAPSTGIPGAFISGETDSITRHPLCKIDFFIDVFRTFNLSSLYSIFCILTSHANFFQSLPALNRAFDHQMASLSYCQRVQSTVSFIVPILLTLHIQ